MKLSNFWSSDVFARLLSPVHDLLITPKPIASYHDIDIATTPLHATLMSDDDTCNISLSTIVLNSRDRQGIIIIWNATFSHA